MEIKGGWGPEAKEPEIADLDDLTDEDWAEWANWSPGDGLDFPGKWDMAQDGEVVTVRFVAEDEDQAARLFEHITAWLEQEYPAEEEWEYDEDGIEIAHHVYKQG